MPVLFKLNKAEYGHQIICTDKEKTAKTEISFLGFPPRHNLQKYVSDRQFIPH